MDKYYIRGIQQIGIGVTDVEMAWKWYRDNFGADIKVFDDDSTASFMLPYTGGEPQRRRAILAISLQGGGGFEIWQYKGRRSLAPQFEIQLGDYGIFAAKIKCSNIAKAHHKYVAQGEKVSEICLDPQGVEYFWIKDPFGNYFQIIKTNTKFVDEHKVTSLVGGAIIGVPNIEEAKEVYQKILGYDVVVYATEAIKQNDLSFVPGCEDTFKRVLLRHSEVREGGFGKLFGPTEIELVEVVGREPKKMFEGRFWGDLGFIHLCFDMQKMDALRNFCKAQGYPFTIDSFEALKGNSFEMGDSSGLFSYIEDKGGTWIEFVEAHKLPLFKGFALDLLNRAPQKPLAKWLIKLLRFKRYNA
jgi:catechol 2,3-dioxygenase-like lactoylglutathione lyase family enzyme